MEWFSIQLSSKNKCFLNPLAFILHPKTTVFIVGFRNDSVTNSLKSPRYIASILWGKRLLTLKPP